MTSAVPNSGSSSSSSTASPRREICPISASMSSGDAPALLDDRLDPLAFGEAERDDHVADPALGAGALGGGRESGNGEGSGRGGRSLTHGSDIGRKPLEIKCQSG